MKKENEKKNQIEPKRVFIENLPRPKIWLLEYIPLIVALVALIISIYSAHLSRKEFIAAHRPYIYASSRKNDDGSMDVKSILICCINAPAKIVKQEYSYIFYNTNGGEEEVINTIPLEPKLTNNILYPSDKTDNQIFFPYDFTKENTAKNPSGLRRRVKIEYNELSNERKYYFEGYWDYNRTHNVWEPTNIFAD